MRLNYISYNVEVKRNTGEIIDIFPMTVPTQLSASTNDLMYAMVIAQYRLPKNVFKRIVQSQIDLDKKLIVFSVES